MLFSSQCHRVNVSISSRGNVGNKWPFQCHFSFMSVVKELNGGGNQWFLLTCETSVFFLRNVCNKTQIPDTVASCLIRKTKTNKTLLNTPETGDEFVRDFKLAGIQIKHTGIKRDPPVFLRGYKKVSWGRHQGLGNFCGSNQDGKHFRALWKPDSIFFRKIQFQVLKSTPRMRCCHACN